MSSLVAVARDDQEDHDEDHDVHDDEEPHVVQADDHQHCAQTATGRLGVPQQPTTSLFDVTPMAAVDAGSTRLGQTK
jgi:hypothetical protein